MAARLGGIVSRRGVRSAMRSGWRIKTNVAASKGGARQNQTRHANQATSIAINHLGGKPRKISGDKHQARKWHA